MIQRSSRAWWLIGTLVFAFMGRARGVQAETQEDLIKHGIDLRFAGDDEGAFRDFQKAMQMARTPKAVAQVGLAEQALGRWEDADVHLAEALRATNDPWVSKNRKTLEDALTVIKQHVARVEVVAEPAGADILVNGKKVGTAPMPGAVRVSAGEVTVEARAVGYITASHTVHLVGGQYQSVVLRLQKEAPVGVVKNGDEGDGEGKVEGKAGKIAAPPAAGDEEGPSTARVAAKWGALGLGGAGLVTGIAFSFIHSNRVSDFDNASNMNCADKSGTAVHKNNGTPAPECQDALDSYKNAQIWQIAGFAAGVAFTATWAVLALTESSAGSQAAVRSKPPATRWACAPALGVTQVSCALVF